MHIHSGRETCDECNPELTSSNSAADSAEPLDVQRRKELNRIKKLYGLRVRKGRGVVVMTTGEGGSVW